MKLKIALGLLSGLALCGYAQDFDLEDDDDDPSDLFHGMHPQDDDDDDATPAPPAVKVDLIDFVAPSTLKFHFAELFGSTWKDHWVKSAVPKYTGVWGRALREKEAIVGDHGLKMTEGGKHHAVATKFGRVASVENKHLVVSYEAKFEEGLQCGGAYLKIFDSETIEGSLEKFEDSTPYVVMFGPDRCGATDKIHFIVRHKNVISGEWEEKHLSKKRSVPFDRNTHLYAFHSAPDNTYEILLDNEVVLSGSFFEDFAPSFESPVEISDPTDSKPDTWDEEEMIVDASAVQPADWDEDWEVETMPEGWEADEPLTIADPNAERPGDLAEDAAWDAPQIPNPKCHIGCGPFVGKRIRARNPWRAPKVTNPNYAGKWEARKVPNPNHYKDPNPYLALAPFDSIGFELWTIQSAILFDNVVVSIGSDWSKMKADLQTFYDATFVPRKSIESQQTKASRVDTATPAPSVDVPMVSRMLMGGAVMVQEHPVLMFIGVASFLGLVVLSIRPLFASKPAAAPVEAAKADEDETEEEPKVEEVKEAEAKELKESAETKKEVRQRKGAKASE